MKDEAIKRIALYLSIGTLAIGIIFLLFTTIGALAIYYESFWVLLFYLVGLIVLFILELFLCYFVWINNDFAQVVWDRATENTRREFEYYAECHGFFECRDKLELLVKDSYEAVMYILVTVGVFQFLNIVAISFLAFNTTQDLRTKRKNELLLAQARSGLRL